MSQAAALQAKPERKAPTAVAAAVVASPSPVVSHAAAAGIPIFMRSTSEAAKTGGKRHNRAHPVPHSEDGNQQLPDPDELEASVQREIAVGAAADPQEHEADEVARRVQQASTGRTSPQPPSLSEKSGCACGGTCPRCTLEAKVHRQPAPQVGPAPSTRQLFPKTGAGAPLPEATRERIEPVLGADLGDVRVHRGPEASHAAQAIGARAFTHHNHIWLGSGQSTDDLGLMAHEATHVVQQGHGGPTRVQRSQDGAGILGGVLALGEGLVSSAVSYGDSAVGAVREGIGSALETGHEAVTGVVGVVRDTAVSAIEQYAPGALAFFRNLRTYLSDRVGAGFDGLFGGLAGRIRREGIAGAMASVLADLSGGALKGLGGLVAGGCSAMGEIAGLLLDMGAKLGRDAIQAVQAGAAAVGEFFSELWARYGAPAAEALHSFAGAIWDDIKRQVGEWWEALAPLRTAVREAWEWLVGVYAEGKATLEAFLDTLFQRAVEKWEEIRTEILPFMGYVKAVGAVLLLLSPMGPFVVAGAAAYGLYQALSYVWGTWGRPLTAEVRAWLAEVALPAVLNGVETLRSALDAAQAWLAGMADTILAQAILLLNAAGAIPYLRMAQRFITGLVEDLQAFAANVKAALDAFAAAVGELLAAARRFFAPILEFLRQTLLVGLLGPFAIIDDGVWRSVNQVAQFALTVPCIRELAGLVQLPAILAQGEHFRSFLKSAWALIQNPEPVLEALHSALAPMVDAVPGIAASVLATAIYPDEEERRLGVQRNLEPALAELQGNWWEELKQMGWTLIWPWDQIGESLPKLVQDGSDAIGAVFELQIGRAIDKFLSVIQDLNVILGALWGWFAVAAVLVGGVLGALGIEFSGGATIGAGAAAGWALAESVGLVLLGAMAATELGVITKSMFDLRFTNRTIRDDGQRQDADEQDYRSIANSTFSLAVMTALVILGAIAQKIASAILRRVRLPRARRPAEPGAPERGSPEGRANDPDSTARTGDFTDEQIRSARDRAHERVRNPDNVTEVSDPELARKYDAEIDLGDGRKFRRNRETGQWCLFRNPRLCGFKLDRDINAAADRATAGTDISDQVRSGRRSKPTGDEWTHSPNWDKWIERGGTIREHSDGSVTLTAKDGTSLRYSPEGDPNFAPFLDDPWGIRQVELKGGFDPEGNRPRDFRRANQQVGHPEWGGESPDGYTWHHLRDGKTMQLVPRRIHRLFRHSGGVAGLP